MRAPIMSRCKGIVRAKVATEEEGSALKGAYRCNQSTLPGEACVTILLPLLSCFRLVMKQMNMR